MSPLLALIRETVSIQQQIERDVERARRKGLQVTDTGGNQWRILAACKLELDVLTGKAALADRIAAGGMSAGEFMEEWNALEEMRTKGDRHAVTG